MRKADTDAWQGIPVDELKSHQAFQKMQLEKTPFADGSVLWTYTRYYGFYQTCDTDATSFLRQVTKPTTCTTIKRTCSNQFVIDKQGIVQSYKAIGNNCNTNCSLRPLSRPCNK